MKTTGSLKSLIAAGLFMCMNAMNAAPALPHNGGKTTQEKDSAAYCLRLNGKLCKTGRNAEKSTVVLVHNNTPLDSVALKSGGSFEFVLKENTWYTVRITHPGSVPKLISICTAVPKNDRHFYELNFDIDELISDKEAEFLDQETLDFPIAIFIYDYKVKRFNFVSEYTSNIKRHLTAPIAGIAESNAARVLAKK